MSNNTLLLCNVLCLLCPSIQMFDRWALYHLALKMMHFEIIDVHWGVWPHLGNRQIFFQSVLWNQWYRACSGIQLHLLVNVAKSYFTWSKGPSTIMGPNAEFRQNVELGEVTYYWLSSPASVCLLERVLEDIVRFVITLLGFESCQEIHLTILAKWNMRQWLCGSNGMGPNPYSYPAKDPR